MTTPEIEAGMQSYPVAILAGGANPNRMRTRVPRPAGTVDGTAGGDTSPVLAGGQQELHGDGTGQALPELPADSYPPGAVQLEEARQLTAHPGTPGTSGKRAHWTGSEWRGGESPGYAPADTQFPGDGDDTAEDLTR